MKTIGKIFLACACLGANLVSAQNKVDYTLTFENNADLQSFVQPENGALNIVKKEKDRGENSWFQLTSNAMRVWAEARLSADKAPSETAPLNYSVEIMTPKKGFPRPVFPAYWKFTFKPETDCKYIREVRLEIYPVIGENANPISSMKPEFYNSVLPVENRKGNNIMVWMEIVDPANGYSEWKLIHNGRSKMLIMPNESHVKKLNVEFDESYNLNIGEQSRLMVKKNTIISDWISENMKNKKPKFENVTFNVWGNCQIMLDNWTVKN